EEPGWMLQADIPRRRMNDGAGAAGDVLPRHILDVALERVLIRIAVAGRRVEVELQLALGVERRALRLKLSILRSGIAAADEREPGRGVFVEDRGRRAVHRRPRERPADRPLLH